MGIVLVEGGAYLHAMFIKENAWDEAWVIRSKHPLNEGIPAPIVKGKLIQRIESATDSIIGIQNDNKTEEN